MSTAQTIIANGFAKSAAARPEGMTATPELLTRIGQCLRAVFRVMARENPALLGVGVSVDFGGTGWARPSDALAVLKVKANAGTVATPPITPGDEIHIVPYDDQAFCLGLPSFTEFGQEFIPTGQAIDPSAGSVLVEYARSPILPTLVTDDIDPFFPSQFDDYLECDIAEYLAIKDQRTEDEATFGGLKNATMGQIIDWCRVQTFSLEQRNPLVSPPLTNTNAGRAQPEKG